MKKRMVTTLLTDTDWLCLHRELPRTYLFVPSCWAAVFSACVILYTHIYMHTQFFTIIYEETSNQEWAAVLYNCGDLLLLPYFLEGLLVPHSISLPRASIYSLITVNTLSWARYVIVHFTILSHLFLLFLPFFLVQTLRRWAFYFLSYISLLQLLLLLFLLDSSEWLFFLRNSFFFKLKFSF